MAKLTTEEFIAKAKAVHGDRYDYSKVEYLNNSTPVLIVCPIHGVFEQDSASHLQGHGCPICADNANIERNRKWTYETCKNEARKYRTKIEFQQGSSGAFKYAYDNDIINDFDWLEEIKKPDVNPQQDITQVKIKRPRIKVPQQKREEEKINSYKVNVSIMFQSLKFGDGRITILYNKKPYVFLHPKIKGFENIMDDVERVGNRVIKNSRFKVEINISKGTFLFLDFDMLKYLKEIERIFPKRNKPIANINKVLLPKENIKFSQPAPVYKHSHLKQKILIFTMVIF